MLKRLALNVLREHFGQVIWVVAEALVMYGAQNLDAVVERPRHSISPGETEQALLEYTAGSQGPIQEFVDVLAQFGTVRVPIVGWVDAPQGGPVSPSTVTES